MDRMLLALLLCLFTLSACTTWKTNNSQHRAVCNQLTTKLIFNGGTSITRQAEIENAEQPLDQRSYDKTCT